MSGVTYEYCGVEYSEWPDGRWRTHRPDEGHQYCESVAFLTRESLIAGLDHDILQWKLKEEARRAKQMDPAEEAAIWDVQDVMDYSLADEGD